MIDTTRNTVDKNTPSPTHQTPNREYTTVCISGFVSCRIRSVSIRRVRIYSVSSILRPAKKCQYRSVSSLYHIILGGGLRLAKKRRVSVRIGSVSPHFLRGRKESRITAVSCCIVLFVTHPKNLLVSETKKSTPLRACILHKCIMSISAYHCCLEVYRSVSAS